MLYKSIRLAGAAVIAAAMLTPTVASAQYYGAPPPRYNQYHGGYDRDSRDGYADQRDDRQGRHRRAYRDDRHCDRGTGGTLLGAIAGGLLGNAAVGRHGNNTAGALAGAGVGALVGRSIDRDC